MTYLESNDLKVHSTSPNFKIIFYNVTDNINMTDVKSYEFESGSSFKTKEDLGIYPYFTFSPESNLFSGANIQSYTFTNSLEDMDGSFSITIKEDTRSLKSGEQYFMDMVRKLDIVEIVENNVTEFYGVVRTISFGATAGAMNKVLTISGICAAGLLKMFNISTDMTSMNMIMKSTENARISQRIANLFNTNKNGVDVAEIFRIVYLAMHYTAKGEIYDDKAKKYKPAPDDSGRNILAALKIQRIFRFIFGVAHDDVNGKTTYDTKLYDKPVEFLDCELKQKYQLNSNLFNASEVNVVSYFNGYLPSVVYEFFHTMDRYNKPKIVIREVPFSVKSEKPIENDQNSYWVDLPCTVIDPSLITDYTLTQTDTNIFTAFYAYPSGSTGNQELRKRLTITDKKNNKVSEIHVVDDDLIHTYGYIPLDVNFLGYNHDSTKQDDILIISRALSEKLAAFYKNLKDFWNGDVTFVNLMKSEKKDDYIKKELVAGKLNKTKTSYYNNNNPRIGTRVKLCGLEFYVTMATHSWRYGEPCKINLKIERGGKYDNTGKFIEPSYMNADTSDNVVNLNPSLISRTWAELITKE